MKTRVINLLNASALLLTAGLWLTSCDTSEEEIADVVVNSDGSELYSKLSHFSSRGYPTDTDTWVIEDYAAATTDFSGLSAAIEALAESDREISLEFPNLTSIPDYAIFGVDDASTHNYDLDVVVSISTAKATSIGNYAFASCSALESIDMPLATSIGFATFSECSALTTVNLPELTSVSSTSFYYCSSITSLDFPKATSVSSLAFGGCAALKSITLPAVTEIGAAAFLDCGALESVSLATNEGVMLTSVEADAFNTDGMTITLGSANSDYVVGNALVIAGIDIDVAPAEIIVVDGSGEEVEVSEPFSLLCHYTANSYPTNSDTWVITNSSATTADFSGLSSAIAALAESGRSITLEFENLASFPDNAIYGDCESCDYAAVTSITAGKATSIGKSVFKNCTGLTEVDMHYIMSIDDSAFENCTSLTAISLHHATYIGESAFYNCTSMTEVEANAVTEIGSYAFGSCTSLHEDIGLSGLALLETVGDYAFSGCSSLEVLSLPSATTIGAGFVSGCSSLTTINLCFVEGCILESVDADAFSGVTPLEITFCLSNLNAEYIDIDSNTLSIGDCSVKFFTISYIDEDSDLGNYDCDCGEEH